MPTMLNPPPKADPALRSLVIAVAIAQFLLPFMITGIAPLLPALGKEFDASAVELSLVIASYTLSLSIMHLIAGRIGDMLGRKRIFLTGLGVFTVVVAIAPFSPSIEIFLVLRFIQAAGAAMMNTCALAILMASASPEMRGRVLGIAMTGMFLGLSIGPSVAGVVTAFFTWKAMFLALVPLCIFAWLIIFYTVKGEWYNAPDAPFDWMGSIFYSLGIASFACGAIWILEGWWAILLALTGIVLLGIFVFVERYVQYPILDIPSLTHNRVFSIGALTAFINFASTFGMLFYLSLYLQTVYKLSVMEAGMLMSVQPLAQVLLSAPAGNLGDRFGAERVATLGMTLCGASLWLLTGLDANTSYAIIFLAQIGVGTGASLFIIPNTSSIMGSVDAAHLSQASGLVGTVRTLGMLTCMMVISLTMNIYLGSEPLSENNVHLFLEALQINFRIFTMLNLIGVIISCLFLNLRRKK